MFETMPRCKYPDSHGNSKVIIIMTGNIAQCQSLVSTAERSSIREENWWVAPVPSTATVWFIQNINGRIGWRIYFFRTREKQIGGRNATTDGRLRNPNPQQGTIWTMSRPHTHASRIFSRRDGSRHSRSFATNRIPQLSRRVLLEQSPSPTRSTSRKTSEATQVPHSWSLLSSMITSLSGPVLRSTKSSSMRH